jgi:hypothetical protein
MTTFVSAFVSNANNRSDRNIEKYIDFGNKFINIPVKKIIFLENNTYEQYFKNKENDLTKFILFNKNDLYLYNYKDNITNLLINTDNPTKDTIEYMLTMCHKTEWIKNAIELNPYNTEQFIWIDFGIFHIIKDEIKFKNSIMNMENKKYNNIRIASCWDPNIIYNIDIYKQIAWYFAGGVFGGDKNILLYFASLMKEKCIEIINQKKSIMWEVNIWYLIYKQFPNLFYPYNADHNILILDNY